jgi:hypothetical protein
MAAQAPVDRARAQAQNCMRRAKTELDELQATRSMRKPFCKTKPIRLCSKRLDRPNRSPSKVALVTQP